MVDRDFFKRLQIVLVEKRWNQTQLAKETGIDIGTISRWKRKGTFPSDTSLNKIVEATGCNQMYLEGGAGDPYPGRRPDYSNVQTGRGDRFSQQNSSYHVGGKQSGGGNITDEAMELAELIQQCESPLRIRKMIEDYRKQLADFGQK